MNKRYLTREETALIQRATEHWLRLRDVELNAAEEAAALLARSELRKPGCTRSDIASLDSTILLEVPGHPAPVPLTLVRPQEEDLWSGRVSLLGALGLPCIGQVVGSEVRLPQGMARFVGMTDPAAVRHARRARRTLPQAPAMPAFPARDNLAGVNP